MVKSGKNLAEENLLTAIRSRKNRFFFLVKCEPNLTIILMLFDSGLVTYGEGALLFNETIHDITRKILVVRIISHEFAHQWFGNLVTPRYSIKCTYTFRTYVLIIDICTYVLCCLAVETICLACWTNDEYLTC